MDNMNEQNENIALIVPLIVKNNAFVGARAINLQGYSKDFVPHGELEAKLFQMYLANPDLFFQVMNTIPWQYGEKETNNHREQLIAFTGMNDTPETKGQWWKQLLIKVRQ